MEEDLLLINKVKESQDVESLKELINRHSGIYVEMVNKYLPNSFEGINKDDVMDDKDFSIYDAAIKFDKNKNTKFSTYVGNLTRWKCLNIYNKNIKYPKICINDNLEKNVSCGSDLKSIEEQEDIKRIFSIIQNHSDKRVRTIFKMRYKNGKKLTPWKKIAKKLSLSIQGCINIHNKHLEEIKRYV
jgi:DNA-directed RNA polymerase specialized sigma subunit